MCFYLPLSSPAVRNMVFARGSQASTTFEWNILSVHKWEPLIVKSFSYIYWLEKEKFNRLLSFVFDSYHYWKNRAIMGLTYRYFLLIDISVFIQHYPLIFFLLAEGITSLWKTGNYDWWIIKETSNRIIPYIQKHFHLSVLKDSSNLGWYTKWLLYPVCNPLFLARLYNQCIDLQFRNDQGLYWYI